jgi:hypothetical protein
MDDALKSTGTSQTKLIRPDLSVTDSLAALLKEIRAEKQEVHLLHRESRKRINRGAHVAAASIRSAKQPALW